MVRSRIGLLFFSVLLLFLFLSTAWANDPDPAREATEKTPYEVGSAGGFTYAVKIDIPAYRGLQPDLSLKYRSSNSSRGSEDDVMGIGWHLDGMSRIERVSQGRGSPRYSDGEDIYQLDGKALMACADGAATNKWSGSYPSRYKTDKASSSCRAGGNFSTLIESDLKILRNAGANEWTVFAADGTRYIFRSPGALSGLTSTNSDADRLLGQRVWLLAEIRNTQATPGVVRFQYYFAGNYGYAARPARITYGSYTVDFGYETRTTPQSQWATGTSILGKQMYRLVSIRVQRGSAKIRAYRLDYAASAETKSSLLSKVTQYGTFWD